MDIEQAPPSEENRSPRGSFLKVFTTLPGLITAISGLLVVLGGIGAIRYTTTSSTTSTTSITTATDTIVPDPAPQPIVTLPTPAIVPTDPSSYGSDDPELVSFSLLVGIRPELGQLTEDAELLLDGISVVAWSNNQYDESDTVDLTDIAGAHDYELIGTYTYLDGYGDVLTGDVTGSGTVVVADGVSLTVQYLGDDQFQLIAI